MATIEQASFANRGKHTLPYGAIKNALKTRADAKNLARTAAEDAIDAAVESFAEGQLAVVVLAVANCCYRLVAEDSAVTRSLAGLSLVLAVSFAAFCLVALRSRASL